MKRIIDSIKAGLNRFKIIFWNVNLPVILLIESSFISIWKKKKKIIEKVNKNIIINGANTFNKGSQAMLFTVVDQIKSKYPNKNIYLFSSRDFEKKVKEKKVYNFKFLPWNEKLQIRFSSFWHKFLMVNSKYDYLENKIKEVLINTNLIIDLSGYRLTSKMGKESWISYLMDIIIAKKYSIPYFIFPQSIGPFNFSLRNRLFFYPLAKLYLKYPKKIFVREIDGIRYIRQFSKINVKKTYDIVLQNKDYNLSNIYKKDINFKDFQIKPNSVCIIPNLQINSRIVQEKIYSIYRTLIIKLIESKKLIYILRHSYDDIKICKKIKNLFPTNENVVLIPDDLTVFEIESIMKKFDFLIASRYHSIVHAYKNGIPVLVIGWAVKYLELLKIFDQTPYLFDINSLNIKELNKKCELLMKYYKNEKEKISTKLNMILKKKTCFDALFKTL